MTRTVTTSPVELAHRSSGGIDVSLVWFRRNGHDTALVRVVDQHESEWFEIPTEPHLALDVYYHPFFYCDFSSSDSGTARSWWPEQREEDGNGRGWLHRSRR
jgi:hypothetical protein